jgi:hypothetical protein
MRFHLLKPQNIMVCFCILSVPLRQYTHISSVDQAVVLHLLFVYQK